MMLLYDSVNEYVKPQAGIEGTVESVKRMYTTHVKFNR